MKKTNIDNLDVSIDWALLRKQKEALCKVGRDPALAGLEHLIDAIQDHAVDSGQFTEEQVFGNLETVTIKAEEYKSMKRVIRKLVDKVRTQDSMIRASAKIAEMTGLMREAGLM